METKTYKTIDREKQGWPSGPWDDEPDKVQWRDGDTGLPCLAVRHHHFGNWCGYVGVPPGHKFHGESYGDIRNGEDEYIDVHGGLTFADYCRSGPTEATGICHVPGAGEPEHVWWFGFDCSHSEDLSPLDEKYAREKGGVFRNHFGDTYKSLAYVQTECSNLARQLAATERYRR